MVIRGYADVKQLYFNHLQKYSDFFDKLLGETLVFY